MHHNTVHGNCSGGKRTPEYRAWVGMKSRCYNPKVAEYPDYGGRGIKVCSRWLNDFEAFLADMGPRPRRGYSLDRIDGCKDYEPSNVRWATYTEQNRNKRGNVPLTVDGITQFIGDWARQVGIHHQTIRSRIYRGWDAKRAVFGSKGGQPSLTRL